MCVCCIRVQDAKELSVQSCQMKKNSSVSLDVPVAYTNAFEYSIHLCSDVVKKLKMLIESLQDRCLYASMLLCSAWHVSLLRSTRQHWHGMIVCNIS